MLSEVRKVPSVICLPASYGPELVIPSKFLETPSQICDALQPLHMSDQNIGFTIERLAREKLCDSAGNVFD